MIKFAIIAVELVFERSFFAEHMFQPVDLVDERTSHIIRQVFMRAQIMTDPVFLIAQGASFAKGWLYGVLVVINGVRKRSEHFTVGRMKAVRDTGVNACQF